MEGCKKVQKQWLEHHLALLKHEAEPPGGTVETLYRPETAVFIAGEGQDSGPRQKTRLIRF
jgi:hypothetical protein